jgi:RNA polymerase sigma-70 factor (ECF subfamily)
MKRMGDSPNLADVFRAHLSDEARNTLDLSRVDELVTTWLARAHAAWPAIDVAPDVFIAHVAGRISIADRVPADVLDAVRPEDLYLACACAGGDDRAIDSFCRLYLPRLEPALRAAGVDEAGAREVEQELSELLFVASDDKPPHIATYAGRGALKSWVKSIAARMARHRVRRARARPRSDDDLEGLVAGGDDPELAHLKALYRDEFRTSFSAAMTSLEPRERTLLRQHYLDELTIDDLGRLHQVHRATAARWLATTRQTLCRRTRSDLTRRLEIPGDDFESVMRLIASQLEVSIRRHLAD